MNKTIKRAALAAASIAGFVGATVGIGADASAKPIQREWHLGVPNAPTVLKVRGTSCALAEMYQVAAQTSWGTLMFCEPYTTSNGATARKWTYLKIDALSHDLCSSTGYLYPNGSTGSRLYAPTTCSGPIVAPRLTFPNV